MLEHPGADDGGKFIMKFVMFVDVVAWSGIRPWWCNVTSTVDQQVHNTHCHCTLNKIALVLEGLYLLEGTNHAPLYQS